MLGRPGASCSLPDTWPTTLGQCWRSAGGKGPAVCQLFLVCSSVFSLHPAASFPELVPAQIKSFLDSMSLAAQALRWLKQREF